MEPETPLPAPAPTPVPAPTPTSTPAPAPTGLTLPPEEVQRLYAAARQLEQFQTDQKATLEAAEQQRLLVLAQKGEAEIALKTQREQYEARVSQLEQSILGDRKTATLARTLTGVTWANEHAAEMAQEILDRRIESVRQPDGSVVVRDKATGRPAADVVKEWLGGPAASIFLKPSSAGGAGASGTATPPPPPAQSFLDIIKAQYAGAPGVQR